MTNKFKAGDTVVFDPSGFDLNYWDNLQESDRLQYYGVLGYGDKRLHLYSYIAEHSPQDGHCILVSMQDQHLETMRHTNDFRLATEDEC